MRLTWRLLFGMTAGLCVPAAPVAQQQTHRFQPTTYYTTYSFAHPPALRIKPGDRVITKTADSGGTDEKGNRVAMGPNPEIGPFYIEGAEPGDALVVTFEKIETNRTTSNAGTSLSGYTVTPAALLQRQPGQAPRAAWMIDKAKGVARLENPELMPSVIRHRQCRRSQFHRCRQDEENLPQKVTLFRDGGKYSQRRIREFFLGPEIE